MNTFRGGRMKMHYIPGVNPHAYATDSVKMSRDQRNQNTWWEVTGGLRQYGETDISGSF